MLALPRPTALRTLAALTLACGLAAMLAAALPSPAAADDREDAQSPGMQPCMVGHRFEPGPIVEGHNRQPTQREFEARMRELRTLSRTGSGSCAALPRSSPGGDIALETSPLPTPSR
jgi:hypothetical protein